MNPQHSCTPAADDEVAARVRALDWGGIANALDAEGHAQARGLMRAGECRVLARLYADSHAFRSRVVMARHGFGRGEYQYLSYPLPSLVASLRRHLYTHLAPVANAWNERMGMPIRYPARLEQFIARCHAAGQTRPTPLMLKYEGQDYNCLHQDLYGEHVFPLQVVFLLSQPGRDFAGGELVMTEQRPRMQSRPMVLSLEQGDAAIIATHHRPVQGTRGVYRVNLRHGVSKVHSGLRYTLGIIFHDAA